MTFLELQDLCLTWLDDVDAGYFTRPQIKRFLNNAIHECQKQLVQSGESWYLTCSQTNTIANQEAYALPSDFLRLNRLEVFTSGDGTQPSDMRSVLIPLTPMESTSVPSGPATPSVYYLKRDCLVLRSTPDRSYPLRLLYTYRVSEMTVDTEIPDCPTQYQEYIAVLATIDGFMKDQRDASQFLSGKKASYEALMKQDADERQVDFGRSVVRTQDDGFEVFY